MRRPTPSLPVAGTDRPPVASTTRLAAMCSPDVRRTSQRSPSRVNPLTRAPSRTITPAPIDCRQQGIEHIFRPVRDGKELAALRFLAQRNPQILLEETANARSSGQARRIFARVWGEPSVTKSPAIGMRRQDVAPPAAADQDLLAGALAAFQQEHRTRAARGPERSHQTGRARADNHDRFSSKIAIRLREASGGRLPTGRMVWPAPSPQSVTRTDYTTVKLLPANSMGSGSGRGKAEVRAISAHPRISLDVDGQVQRTQRLRAADPTERPGRVAADQRLGVGQQR